MPLSPGVNGQVPTDLWMFTLGSPPPHDGGPGGPPRATGRAGTRADLPWVSLLAPRVCIPRGWLLVARLSKRRAVLWLLRHTLASVSPACRSDGHRTRPPHSVWLGLCLFPKKSLFTLHLSGRKIHPSLFFFFILFPIYLLFLKNPFLFYNPILVERHTRRMELEILPLPTFSVS